MVEDSNQNVFLIPIDASNFAEFEISEFEIARVDCNMVFKQYKPRSEGSRRSLAPEGAF